MHHYGSLIRLLMYNTTKNVLTKKLDIKTRFKLDTKGVQSLIEYTKTNISSLGLEIVGVEKNQLVDPVIADKYFLRCVSNIVEDVVDDVVEDEMDVDGDKGGILDGETIDGDVKGNVYSNGNLYSEEDTRDNTTLKHKDTILENISLSNDNIHRDTLTNSSLNILNTFKNTLTTYNDTFKNTLTNTSTTYKNILPTNTYKNIPLTNTSTTYKDTTLTIDPKLIITYSLLLIENNKLNFNKLTNILDKLKIFKDTDTANYLRFLKKDNFINIVKVDDEYEVVLGYRYYCDFGDIDIVDECYI